MPSFTACDDYNLYVCRQGKLLSSDVGAPEVGQLPFQPQKFDRFDDQYYFLDGHGQLCCNGFLIATDVRDFSSQFILFRNGTVAWRSLRTFLQLEIHIARLAYDLLIGSDQCLYDATGTFLLKDVVDAHTDGNEIVAVKTNGTVEYIGDNTERHTALQNILTARGVKKAVVSNGSIILLSHAGEVVASGENRYYECGITADGVDWIQTLKFPLPVVDIEFNRGIGWAVLSDESIWVWGFNHPDHPRFLQWYSETYISPRRLEL